MNDRYLFKAKTVYYIGSNGTEGEWVTGCLMVDESATDQFKYRIQPTDDSQLFAPPIDPSTLCQCTGLKDKDGKLIWENDILMGHGNPKDLAKAVFGEFYVIDVETLEKVDKVIGWYYEVIPTDAISKCEPFCLAMPLDDFYINKCEFEVIGNIFDNPELLEK